MIKRIPPRMFIRLFIGDKNERGIKFIPEFKKYNPKIKSIKNRILPTLAIKKRIKQTF